MTTGAGEHDDAAQVIMGYLQRAGLAHLWSANGPTADALGLLARRDPALSREDALVLRIAVDLWSASGLPAACELREHLWNWSGHATVQELVEGLGAGELRVALDAIADVRAACRRVR